MVYADAVAKLQGDGLQVEETNVTGIFNTADYKVTSQSPAGGTQVSIGSLVKLTIEAIAQPPTGYSSVTVNNVNSDEQSVDLYIVDLTSNPNVSASEGTLDWNDSKVVNLTTNGHNYQVIAVDTELTGCPSSDPFTVDCQRAITPPPGVLCSSTGGTYPLNVN
jgi:beta-lactam-binding protein with PASTA domain